MSNPFLPVIASLLPEPQASLLSGILFGTKASFPPSLYQALVTTGTLHIIALSGMNITILTALVAKGTGYLGKKISSLVTIGIIVLFILFVGASPSVVRAGIMGGLSLLAVIFGRQYWALFGLFVSSFVMLAIAPSLLGNLSFQLSVLSTLGIIVAQRWGRKRPGDNGFLFWLRENLTLTLAAQLFTLPVILWNFHRVSLIAPVANLLIEWAIQPVMILGFATALLGWLWWPAGFVAAWFAWVPLTYIINVVEGLSKIPYASLEF